MYARTYWPPSYWPQTYWAKEGADPPDGYWQPRYWAMSYWMPNYWPGEPRLVVEPPAPTGGRYSHKFLVNIGWLMSKVRMKE